MVALALVPGLSEEEPNFIDRCLKKFHDLLVDVIQEIGASCNQMDLEELSNRVFEQGKKITAAITEAAIEQRTGELNCKGSQPYPNCSSLARAKGSKPRTA